MELRQPGGGGGGSASRPPSQPPSQPPLLCTCIFASPPLHSRSQDDVTNPSVLWKGALGYIFQYGWYIFWIEDNYVL